MKTLIITISLLIPALAFADNCYVLERGTPDWQDCKDQAQQNQRISDDLKQDMREIQTENANASANDTQTEALQQLLQKQTLDQANIAH